MANNTKIKPHNPFHKYRSKKYNKMLFELAEHNNVNIIIPSESWFKRPLIGKLSLPHNVKIMKKYKVDILSEIKSFIHTSD